MTMYKSVAIVLVLFLVAVSSFSQQITYSLPQHEDDKNMNFEVLGKVNNQILIFKNVRSKYALSIYSANMDLVEKVELDFIPSKTFNVDFIVYPTYMYCIYQYHTKGMVYCMGAKLDESGKIVGTPVELDKAEVGFFGETRIYNLVHSEDKKKIMVYKIQKRRGTLELSSILMNSEFDVLKRCLLGLPFDDQKDDYGNFSLDNEGNLIFTRAEKNGLRNAISKLSLYNVLAEDIKDTMYFRDVNLSKNYLDGIKLKVDNINKTYIINAIFFKQKRGNVEGFFTSVFRQNDEIDYVNQFISISDSLKYAALTDANLKSALNNFMIKNIIVKKDGGYILIAEDFYTRQSDNTWNRFDNFYNGYNWTPYGYYYSPYGNQFYRPFNRFGNFQNTRYLYNNILVLGFSNMATLEWGTVIEKQQDEDETDNHLSFINFNSGSEIRFLFNKKTKRKFLLNDISVNAEGAIFKNPVLRSQDRGYEFMPQFGKQVGAKQLIIPCTYRNYICFAKIEF